MIPFFLSRCEHAACFEMPPRRYIATQLQIVYNLRSERQKLKRRIDRIKATTTHHRRRQSAAAIVSKAGETQGGARNSSGSSDDDGSGVLLLQRTASM